MRIKYIIFIMVIIGLSVSLWAQDINNKNALGFHFGSSTGSGYAMRWMGEKYGLQATLGGYTRGDNDVFFSNTEYVNSDESIIRIKEDGRDTSVIGGCNLIYILDYYKRGRFYLMGGGSYKFFYQTVYTMDYQLTQSTYNDYYTVIPGTRKRDHEIQHRWTVGLGPGFDFSFAKKFCVAFELPITYNWKHDLISYVPQIGVYYYFK